MSNVDIKYLKDSNNKIFSPITGIESVYTGDKNEILSSMLNREKFIFHGYTIVSSPSLNTFASAKFHQANYITSDATLENGEFVVSDLGAVGYADYEIFVRFNGDRLLGVKPRREIFIGICVNDDLRR